MKHFFELFFHYLNFIFSENHRNCLVFTLKSRKDKNFAKVNNLMLNIWLRHKNATNSFPVDFYCKDNLDVIQIGEIAFGLL